LPYTNLTREAMRIVLELERIIVEANDLAGNWR
jgi:hypothetical protein